MTEIREKAVKAAKSVRTAEAVKTVKVGKDGEKSEGGYQNLAQVSCICYPHNFGK